MDINKIDLVSKPEDIYPKYSYPSFKGTMYFEINSFLGRHIFNSTSKFIIKGSPVLVDIGVGSNFTNGWIHVDFYRSRLCKPLNLRKVWFPNRRMPEVETDLRYPLKCPDNIVDGIYSGHTLEHLCPTHAYQLLREMFRILKPGCWIRINVPDLKHAVDFYNGFIDIPQYSFKAEAIGNLTQNYGHQSVWDAELLRKALEISGFENISIVEFGKSGSDARLIKEEQVRESESLCMEASKPMN